VTPAPAAGAGAAPTDPAAGAVFCEYKPYAGEGMVDIRCIAGPRYKLAWNRGDREELYDTWADPVELHNRADDAQLAGVRHRLRERLLAWMRETDDPLAGVAAQDLA
jgi:hypothetical protein